jgi:biotin carboxylase
MLGNNLSSIEILQIAKRLGAYTIAVDNTDDSPLKYVADKFYIANTADIKRIVEIGKIENIDTVMAGVSESNISFALTVSEILNLPFYTTREQWEVTSNKDKFKELCKTHDISVINEYKEITIENDDLSNLHYPLIIKPVDNGGGRGISVCKNENELRIAYKKAMVYSKRKKCVIENFMDADEVSIYYTIQDGYISLSGICDRYLLKQEGFAPIRYLRVFPSKHTKLINEKHNQKFHNVFKSLNIKNGFLLFQALVKGEELYPFELGFRIGGGEAHKNIAAATGVNPLEMLVRFSLTGKMSGWDLKADDTPYFKKWTCAIAPVLKQGKIKKISGIDEISKFPEFIDITRVYYEGDEIKEEHLGTLKQILATIFLVADTEKLLFNAVKRVIKNLSVVNENNESMLIEEGWQI